MAAIYDPKLSRIITRAIQRLYVEMAQDAPFMADQVAGWVKSLAGTAQPEDYFKHPLAFPTLLLPWWLEEAIRPELDLDYQADIAYSSINGYYYIRLVDNLMDGEAVTELKLLPAISFFHTQFQRVYHRYFDHQHPFWKAFARIWFGSAEFAIRDASLGEVDYLQFKEVAAKKVSAGKIPLAAVCYRYDRPDLISAWAHFLDRFGGWHQMLNDLFDWHKDLQRGARTYFLDEARRRGYHSPEMVTTWVVEEGFDWGVHSLQSWMVDLKEMAGRLQSPSLQAYLAQRETMLQAQQAEVTAGLREMARLLRMLGS